MSEPKTVQTQMNEDRVWEMYYSDEYQPETRKACRDRIQWLAKRARGRILDIGCSQGVLPILLGREGNDVVGIDIEQASIKFARERLAEEPANVSERVELIVADVFKWKPETTFDTVILGEVLEHLSEPCDLLTAVRSLMAPDARLLVTVPLGWLEHHDHKQAFLPTEFVRLLEQTFGIQELVIQHNKICVVLTVGPSMPEAVESQRLLEAVEKALLKNQYVLADTLALARRRRERVEGIEKQVKALQRTVVDLKKTGKEQAEALKQQLADTENHASVARRTVERTITFQLGKLILRTVKRPYRIVRLPDRLVAIALRARRVRRDKRLKAGRGLVHRVYDGSYRVDLPKAEPITDAVKRRILHMLEYSMPHHQNGYTLRSFQLIRAQKHHGWDPIVVTKPQFPSGDATKRGPEIVAGVPHYRLPGRKLQVDNPTLPDHIRVYVQEAAQLVEELRPSIIQAASNFRNAYAAMELARNYSLPFVYEVRGLWEETRIANGRLTVHDKRYRQLVNVETACMQAADAIITLGTSLRDELVRRGLDREKIFLVRNAVHLDDVKIRPPRKELRESLELTGNFVVSYIGSVSRLENLHILIEAMREIRKERKRIAVLIVGDGTELDDLKRLAKDHGLTDCVRFAGKVPHENIPDYYAITDVVVCTRGKHRVCEIVTPLKPYEAMGYRKPIIVSDIPALREMVNDGETGCIVPAEDPVALASKIIELADNPERCASLTESAYDWVREHRSWERVTEGYKEAYEFAKANFAARSN